MNITVYAKPYCPQCDATKRHLERQGIEYSAIDITQDEQALDQLLQAGFAQAPVVVTEQDAWSGYRPDKIRDLVGVMQ